VLNDDEFSDRIKGYESTYTGARLEGDFFIARIDGRAFSKYTRYMQKPYDTNMSWAMQNTTHALMEKTDAVVGYTQSDEITLAFKSSAWFDGKVQKLASVICGITTAEFVRRMLETEHREHTLENLPHFDCRVFSVPTQQELVNAVLWRVHDCKKNAISSAARAQFSHKSLQGKSGIEMIRMLRNENISFEDHYPSFYRFGQTLYKEKETQQIPDEIWNLIPDNKKPESRSFKRHVIKTTAEEMTYFKLAKLLS